MTELSVPHRRVVGIKQSARTISEGKAQKIYLALDADDHILRRFRELCRQAGVEFIEVETMKELGQACRIDIGTAVACVTSDQAD